MVTKVEKLKKKIAKEKLESEKRVMLRAAKKETEKEERELKAELERLKKKGTKREFEKLEKKSEKLAEKKQSINEQLGITKGLKKVGKGAWGLFKQIAAAQEGKDNKEKEIDKFVTTVRDHVTNRDITSIPRYKKAIETIDKQIGMGYSERLNTRLTKLKVYVKAEIKRLEKQSKPVKKQKKKSKKKK